MRVVLLSLGQAVLAVVHLVGSAFEMNRAGVTSMVEACLELGQATIKYAGDYYRGCHYYYYHSNY